MNSRNFVCIIALLLSACASRGYYLSQQIPGYNKHLEEMPLNVSYKVGPEGQIYEVKKISETPERSLASSDDILPATNADSTLDPSRGALLIGADK